jgi:deazaflavin-dependent oxidoreductase (nitroreductase family)
MTRLGGRIGVALYDRFGARLSGGTPEAPVLLLTVPGRRTGLTRRACVRTLPVDGGWLVWGTGSGSVQDPDWFRNIRAAGACDVRNGEDRFHAQVDELVGAQREAAWASVLAALPSVAKYERKVRRTIPVARLTPLPPRDGRAAAS